MITQNKPALISGRLICQKTGIIFKVKEFRITVSIQQCFKCQGFGHKAQYCTKKQKYVVCGEAHSHNNCPKKEERTPKCANCRGPHVANYRGCPAYKDQPFRQHVVHKKVSASILKQVSPPRPNNTFNFTAEKIVSLVTNVVIQIAQPQLCTKKLPEKQIPSVKTDHRNRERMLFDSIISGQFPLPQCPLSSAPRRKLLRS